MAFDAGTVERVRDALDRLGEGGFREKHVFGGWGFLYGKSTFVIVWGEGILAKLPAESYRDALERPGVRPFTPGGERAMGTWVVVHAEVIADDPELAEWVALGLRGMRQGPAAKSETRGASTAREASALKRRAPKRKPTAKAEGAKRESGAKGPTGAKGAKSAARAKTPQRASKGKPRTRRR